MGKTNEQRAGEASGTSISEYREDPRIEVARGGPVTFSQKTLEKLGIIKPGESIEEFKKSLTTASGGRHFRGGTLSPQDQARKNRAVLHIQRMDAIRKISQDSVDILKSEAASLLEQIDLYPERRFSLENRIRGMLHYIEIGETNGVHMSAAALEDGNYAFEKELESAARENQRNLRMYKEEHVQTVSFTDLKRKIQQFEDD